jgi:uncharacterized OsmC-like protein
MNAEQLKALQAPLKALYREDPQRARQTLRASGKLDTDKFICVVDSFKGPVPAGLHPATGGDGRDACSGDMLLEALVGCAGVTLKAVATAMNITIRSGTIRAEGDMDFRGTLGVSKEVPIGFEAIRLYFDLDTDASPDQLQTLVKLTERYCVVYQTLAKPPRLSAECHRQGGALD